jgi:hypothetical protein
MTDFHELFSTKLILVHLSGIEFSLTHLLDDMVHVTEFGTEGFDVTDLDEMFLFQLFSAPATLSGCPTWKCYW